MTTKQLKKLKTGTIVRWDDNREPGTVLNEARGRLLINWPDGQVTDGSDDWALEHVTVQPCIENFERGQ